MFASLIMHGHMNVDTGTSSIPITGLAAAAPPPFGLTMLPISLKVLVILDKHCPTPHSDWFVCYT